MSGEAEDAALLTQGKDDNEAWRRKDRRFGSISCRMGYFAQDAPYERKQAIPEPPTGRRNAVVVSVKRAVFRWLYNSCQSGHAPYFRNHNALGLTFTQVLRSLCIPNERI